MRAFITSALRSAFSRYPNKFKALKAAFAGRKKNRATGRDAAHYRCANCRSVYPGKEVQVDHIEPVVDKVVGFKDWDTYIDRMFCGEEGLQILCKKCHAKKTAEERKERGRKTSTR
jgi:5-methylcytosine-specific restriction endonuclease McrA